jgi:hypothetical protein
MAIPDPHFGEIFAEQGNGTSRSFDERAKHRAARDGLDTDSPAAGAKI